LFRDRYKTKISTWEARKICECQTWWYTTYSDHWDLQG